MAENPEAANARCLCIDIETAQKDRTILRELGVFRPDLDVRKRLLGKALDLVERLDALTRGAAFVLGHNVIAHDQPALALLHPGLALHDLPLLDTLELSPVAFPQNPYHRLLKDYKLCTTTRNDPVRGAELAVVAARRVSTCRAVARPAACVDAVTVVSQAIRSVGRWPDRTSTPCHAGAVHR